MTAGANADGTSAVDYSASDSGSGRGRFLSLLVRYQEKEIRRPYRIVQEEIRLK